MTEAERDGEAGGEQHVETLDEEELVAAPAWATLILVLAPFVVGLLVILALRWLL